MTGIFSTPTPEKCNHYARFMQYLGRHEAEAVFWTLFIFMIFLLVIASTRYARACETHIVGCNNDDPVCDHDCRRTRLQCLYASLVCSALAVPSAVMQAFAALNIQFCDGEDLMMLYWGFWTLIQVGSVIAIFGIVLNQWKCLRDHELPPWPTALGTPVLVLAGLGHSCWIYLKAVVQKTRAKTGDVESSGAANELRLSRAPTVVNYPRAINVGLPQSQPVEAGKGPTLQVNEAAPRPGREVQFVENGIETTPP